MDAVSAKLRGGRLDDATSGSGGFELRLLHPALPFQPTPWEIVIDSLPARPLLPIRRMTVEKTGVNSRPNPVTPSIPENTAVPSDWRISAPAPVATMSGATPRMNAKDVIRIGRSLVRAARTAASPALAPSSCALRANSTIRIAFLVARPTRTRKPL